MTVKHRERAWTDFIGWCRARRLRPLPAHPWTVAAYARWCEGRHRYPVIVDRVRSIARAHVLACAPAPDRHPIVTRTLLLIEMRARSRPQRAALFPKDGIGQDARATPPQPTRQPAPPARRRLRATPPLVPRRPQPA
jgi:hypothetical protein